VERPVAAAIIQFVIAALVIIVAGAALTRFADAIADLTQVGKLLVGSILLAGATSLPELMVTLSAVRMDMPDMAVGNLAGSCLMNLMILGIADLAHRSRGHLLSRISAAHALAGIASLTIAAVAAIGILASHQWPDLVLGGLGPGTWLVAVTYVLTVRMVFYDQRLSAQQEESHGRDVMVPAGRITLRTAIIGFLIAAAAIFFAAPYIAESAGTIADLSGLGKTFVGTTMVSLCTTLPELVATLTAVRMGAIDLAIGNVFGSNAFNAVLLVPLDIAYPGSLLAAVSTTHVVTYLCSIMIASIAIMGQLYHVERRTRILEPDAVLVILLVLAALGLIYLMP